MSKNTGSSLRAIYIETMFQKENENKAPRLIIE